MIHWHSFFVGFAAGLSAVAAMVMFVDPWGGGRK